MAFLKGLLRRIGRTPSTESSATAQPASPNSPGASLSGNRATPSGASRLSSFESGQAAAPDGPSDPATRFDRLTQQGFDHLRHERLDAAAVAYEEAARMSSTLPAGHPHLPELYALMALTRFYGGDLKGAAKALKEGEAKSGAAPSPALERVETRLLLAQGKSSEASARLREAAALELKAGASTAGPSHYIGVMAEEWTALVFDALGQIEEAALQFARAEALAAGRWNLSSVKADLALLAGAQGRFEEARDHARDCEKASRGSEEPARLAEAHAVWAELAAAQGDLGKANSEYRAALRIYREIEDPDLEAQVQQAQALLAAA